jgi:hypothetical protein
MPVAMAKTSTNDVRLVATIAQLLYCLTQGDCLMCGDCHVPLSRVQACLLIGGPGDWEAMNVSKRENGGNRGSNAHNSILIGMAVENYK